MAPGKSGRRQGGFTYLGVLFLLVLMGIGLAAAGQTWTLASQRSRERQLLWVGAQYARAIRAYYEQTPGAKQYPSKLEDLVEDQRFPEPRHHLRQLYLDPITQQPMDVILAPDGRIGGVHSHSDETPLKQRDFPQRWKDFKDAAHYSDWLFKASDPTSNQPKAAAPKVPLAPSFRPRPGGAAPS
jgi:type II secretory pathway pseudopilin PulG